MRRRIGTVPIGRVNFDGGLSEYNNRTDVVSSAVSSRPDRSNRYEHKVPYAFGIPHIIMNMTLLSGKTAVTILSRSRSMIAKGTPHAQISTQPGPKILTYVVLEVSKTA